MKGILFKPWKQKAIRGSPLGELWQTRRLDHLKEINQTPDAWWFVASFEDNSLFRFANDKLGKDLMVKPLYRIGETVYIKEALRKDGRLGDTCYDDEYMTPVFRNGVFGKLVKWQWKGYKLSPLFMPAWAARTFIKITGVTPERLKDITLEDIQKEGCPEFHYPDGGREIGVAEHYRWFQMLWDSIYPEYPFDTSPFVWRICFVLTESR